MGGYKGEKKEEEDVFFFFFWWGYMDRYVWDVA